MSDKVFVSGLALHAFHGVMQHEAKVGQTFRLDLTLDIDLAGASRSDKLADTVGYDQVVEVASRAFCGRRYRLIEAAAGAVADAVLDRFSRVAAVQVTVHKPHAPIAATFADVGVTIVAHPLRRTMAEALLALGGNVGDVRDTLDRAVAMLCAGDDVRLLRAPRTIARRPGASLISRPSSTSASRLKPGCRRTRCLPAPRVERKLGRDRAANAAGARAQSTSIFSPMTISPRRTRFDAPAPAPVRTRLRAAAVGGDCPTG